jgi:hypothetical protein
LRRHQQQPRKEDVNEDHNRNLPTPLDIALDDLITLLKEAQDFRAGEKYNIAAEVQGMPTRLWTADAVQRFSLRLVVLPPIRFAAKSSAPVGSFCQSRLCSCARCINPKQRRARFRALRLRFAPEIDSASLRSFPRHL